MAQSAQDYPSSGRFEGREHLLAARVYYEDTDFTGVVYHAGYLRFLERGRSDFLRAIGVSHAALLEEDPPSAYALTRMEIVFKAPARIDDALLIATTYDEIAGPRLIISQSITRAGQLLIEAKVEACCISLSGRPKKPSLTLIRQLTPLLAAKKSDF